MTDAVVNQDFDLNGSELSPEPFRIVTIMVPDNYCNLEDRRSGVKH